MKFILFYQSNRLRIQLSDFRSRSIVRLNDHSLAEQLNDPETDTLIFLATNHSHSIIQMAGRDIQNPLSYSRYGHCTKAPSSSSLLAFNGQRIDPLAGLYLLGNGRRAYRPWLMRFQTPDSASPFADGGINSYAYCADDPVNYNDPSGHNRNRVLGPRNRRGQLIPPTTRRDARRIARVARIEARIAREEASELQQLAKQGNRRAAITPPSEHRDTLMALSRRYETEAFVSAEAARHFQAEADAHQNLVNTHISQRENLIPENRRAEQRSARTGGETSPSPGHRHSETVTQIRSTHFDPFINRLG